MTPLPVNILKLLGGGSKSVAFVVMVFAAIAIIAAKQSTTNQSR